MFKEGDKILMKRRPKGHDVPGIVKAVDSKYIWVEIRPGKCVPHTHEAAKRLFELAQ